MTFEIVQIIQEFNTAGGAERVAWDLSIAFSHVGQVNSVVASHVPQHPPQHVRMRPIAPWLSHLPKRGLFRHVGRLMVVPAFTIAASFVTLPKRDNVLISHGDTLYGDILVVHAVNAENLKEKRRAGQWGWILNPLHAWVAIRDRLMIGGLRYRRYVAVSDRVKHELMVNYSVPAERIEIIPNGIDLAKFQDTPDVRKAVRGEFKIPDGARLLLFVGHEFSRKGLAYVIEAMRALDDPSVWLLVVGSDNRKPYISMAGSLANRIVFAGERRDMERIYPAADVFVLPTAYETFSLVCMEAMACGIPVLATRVGGIEEYLKDGVNGYGISRNGHDIAKKLTRVLSSKEQLETLRAGAIATARSYSWVEISRRYLTLAEDVLKEKYA